MATSSINLANMVTLGRVILVPVIFWLLLVGATKAAFIAFFVAGISDAVDGFLAKRFGMKTELGAYLDPLADKLLIVSVYLALGFAAHLPSWLVIAVVSRDILIVLGIVIAWMMGQVVTIKPLGISKANTAAQILLASTVLADLGFSLGLEDVRTVLVWSTALLTVLSLAAYLGQWLALVASSNSLSPPSDGGT